MTPDQTISDLDRIHAACRKLSMHSISETMADTLQDAAANINSLNCRVDLRNTIW